MHFQASQRSANEREDERTQRALLAFVLHEHPAQLTADDLTLEVGQADGTDRAIGVLVSVRLLRRQGESVLPTRAALHFERLESL
jgi:hypothetical protein